VSARRSGLVLGLAVAWAASAAAAGPHVVTVHALDDRFDAPERVPSGPTAFAFLNKGWQSHRMRVFALPPDLDPQTLAEALAQGGALPLGVSALGGTLAERAEGDASVILALEPGPHALVCDLTGQGAHAGRVLVHPLEVLRYDAATLPPNDLEIRLGDAEIAAPLVVAPGPHALRVENDGTRPHALAIARLRHGRGLGQAREWLRAEPGPAPMIRVAGTAPLSPGRAILLAFTLPVGDYVVYAPTEKSESTRAEEALVRALAVRAEKLD
jgi:hypothetical protein